MNGIEKIISRITADAEAEAAAVKAASDARCADIRAEYEKKTREQYEKLSAEGSAAASTRYDRMCGTARLDAKKALLLEKQQLIEKTFDRAVDKLAALPDGEYTALCARLAANASVSGTEALVLSPADRTARGEAILEKANGLLSAAGKTAKLSLSAETRNIRGGVILVNGKIEMNCSFELLAGGLKNELSGEVAKTLFD